MYSIAVKMKAKKIADTSFSQIKNTIREGVLQELIGYLAEQNDVKVDMNPWVALRGASRKTDDNLIAS